MGEVHYGFFYLLTMQISFNVEIASRLTSDKYIRPAGDKVVYLVLDHLLGNVMITFRKFSPEAAAHLGGKERHHLSAAYGGEEIFWLLRDAQAPQNVTGFMVGDFPLITGPYIGYPEDVHQVLT